MKLTNASATAGLITLASATAVPKPPTAVDFVSYGCFSQEALDSPFPAVSNAFNTPFTCREHCAKTNPAEILFVGLQGDQCICGAGLARGSEPVSAAECSIPCPGFPEDPCGGPDTLINIWGPNGDGRDDSPAPTGTVTMTATGLPFANPTSSPGMGQDLGCWEAAALADATEEPLTHIYMSLSTCLDHCKENHPELPFMALAGNDCYCGSGLAGYSDKYDDGECSIGCPGYPLQRCGGPDGRVNIRGPYDASLEPPTALPSGSPGQGEHLGCREPAALADATEEAFTSPYMSVGSCFEHCEENHPDLPVIGILDGNKCFCGSALVDASKQFPDTDCSIPCPGYPTERCGGRKDRMSIRGPAQQGIPASSASPTASSTSPSASDPVSTAGAALGSVVKQGLIWANVLGVAAAGLL